MYSFIDLVTYIFIYSPNKYVHIAQHGSCHILGAEKQRKKMKHSSLLKKVTGLLDGSMQQVL